MKKQMKQNCKFYLKGHCRKGTRCDFSHEINERNQKSVPKNATYVDPDTPRINYTQYIEKSRALLASKELINGGNLFYFGTPRVDCLSFLFNKMFLNLEHISQRQAHDFVFACLASTILPDNDILVNIAAPKEQKIGIKLLNLMLEAEYSTNVTEAQSIVLNFQNILAPLISFLTHPRIIDSALHEYSSIIINLCRNKMIFYLPRYLNCLEKLTNLNKITQSENELEPMFNSKALTVFPISFVQLYLPIVRLVRIIITHFRDENYNQFMLTSIETLALLVTKLEKNHTSETGYLSLT
jgi:hypothetical protein